MKFNGISIDTIWGLRKHFSVDGMIAVVDNRFALRKWVSDMLAFGDLSDAEAGLIERMQSDLEQLMKGSGTAAAWDELSPDAERNADLMARMQEWEDSVREEKRGLYRACCALMLRLAELAQHAVLQNSDEETAILRYLSAAYFEKNKSLTLMTAGRGKATLLCSGVPVCTMSFDAAAPLPEGAVFAAAHPDTGYLAVDAKGRVVNGSAFFIPEIGKKAVKVALSHSSYAILTEDGGVVHNISFSPVPDAPAKDIELCGDRLTCVPMY